eukprot:symbB.v1.2.007732.t1/scaffold457.1/size330934/2
MENQRAQQLKHRDDATWSGLLKTEAFQVSQPPRFLFIALTTNFSYIAALHYLPASLNTAIFSSNPVFTLLLQSFFLPEGNLKSGGPKHDSEVCASLWTGKALSVTLSVVGVLLITEPWHNSSEGPTRSSRILGAALSLFAALGTSIYQVYFKRTFGDQMKPDEVPTPGDIFEDLRHFLGANVVPFAMHRGLRDLARQRCHRRLGRCFYRCQGFVTARPSPPARSTSDAGNPIALFIDGDNVSPFALRSMLQALRDHWPGESKLSIPIRRAYISKQKAASFETFAQIEGVEPVVVPQHGAALKDAGDLMLALDAAETCLKGTCCTIAIASEDLDFLILLRKLRTWGCRSVLLLPERDNSRSRRFQVEEADDVVCYPQVETGNLSLGGLMDTIRLDVSELDLFAEISQEQYAVAEITEDRQRQMKKLQDVLQELKYLPKPPEQGVMRAALAKFFYVNQFGVVTLWPLHSGLSEAFAALAKSKHKGLLPNPGTLAFISPRSDAGGRSGAVRQDGFDANYVAAGGPFLTYIGEDLVERILWRLGFLEAPNVESQQAIEVFCHINRKTLQKYDFHEVSASTSKKTRQRLHEMFSQQHILQAWRAAVGLFLAHMGGWASILLGFALAFMLNRGIYTLDLTEVPWAMVIASSLSSALFNFLIKFGLSRETPVTTSLGTQIGIPLNLLVDVLIVHSHFHWCQAGGVLTMLLSFSVWHHSEAILRKSGELNDLSTQLLDSRQRPPTESLKQ